MNSEKKATVFIGILIERNRKMSGWQIVTWISIVVNAITITMLCYSRGMTGLEIDLDIALKEIKHDSTCSHNWLRTMGEKLDKCLKAKTE